MQISKHLALIAVALLSTIIQPNWPLTVVTVFLTLLYAWLEWLLNQDKKASNSIEKRIKDLEEAARAQSFTKVFK